MKTYFRGGEGTAAAVTQSLEVLTCSWAWCQHRAPSSPRIVPSKNAAGKLRCVLLVPLSLDYSTCQTKEEANTDGWSSKH